MQLILQDKLVYRLLLQQQHSNLVKLQNNLHKDKHKHNSLVLLKLVWLILHRKLQHKILIKQQHMHKQLIQQQD